MNQAIGPDNLIVVPNGSRGQSVWHRQGITAPDVLATPSTPTIVDAGNGLGSLAAATNFKAGVAAANRFGVTPASSITNVTTASDGINTHAVDITPSTVTGAEFYDVFMSTAAAPLWVARITAAQLAGGCTVTAVGTVSAGGPAAGKVRVNVQGTGGATGSAPWNVISAYTPALITPISCIGYTKAHIYGRVNLTDPRSGAPAAMTLQVYGKLGAGDATAGDFYKLAALTFTANLTAANVLLQELTSVTAPTIIDGQTGLVVLFQTLTQLSPNAFTVDIFVELA